MHMQKEVTTTREVEAREIPSGTRLVIPEATPLAITQSLGGSYTVITPYGSMARIDGSASAGRRREDAKRPTGSLNRRTVA